MRISITFEKRAADRLEKLAKGRSKADVVREALVLEEVLQEAESTHSKLIIRAADGTEREIVRA